MSRPRRFALAALCALAGTALAAAPAWAGWGRPFQFAAPGTADYLSPLLAFSGSGTAAAAFGVADIDVPGSEQAFLSRRTSTGRVLGPQQVAGAQQVLAMTWSGAALQLLVGVAPSNLTCCSSAAAVRVSAAGTASRPAQVVGGLAGQTLGQLLTLGDGRQLAAIASATGVWVSESDSAGRFGGARRLSAPAEQPVGMDAVTLGGQNATVAWSSGTGITGQAQARSIDVATASAGGPPLREHVALTVASGHRVDELAIARRGSGATLFWIESWFDARGGYHSQVEAEDVTPGARAVPLSPANRIATGLSAAGDPAGDQGVAWEACVTARATCVVQAAGRPARGNFIGSRTLGGGDPDTAPSLAISPSGQVIVGWVSGGRPQGSVGFGRPTALSTTIYAADLTVAYGPRRTAIAAWSQGTLNPSIVGAAFTGR